MKILVVLSHPDENSFNHAIAQTVLTTLSDNGHTVVFHDLYKEKFDPILPKAELSTDASLPPEIESHCIELEEADGIIIVHPNWWGQPPAILKGWIDRVIRPKVAYRFLEGDGGEGVPIGLLKAKAAMVFNTANTPRDREQEIFGDPLQKLWKDCIFDLCGVKEFYRKMFTVMVTSDLDQRKAWLKKVACAVDEYFPS